MHNMRYSCTFLIICFFLSIPPANAGNRTPCDAITMEQAAELLGTKPSDLKTVTSDMMPERCVIRSKTDLLKALSFSIYREKTPSAAAASLRKMAESFAVLSKIEHIPALGDEAIYAGDDRLKRLVLRKGRFLIDIRNPRDRARQEKAARILLRGIR